MECNKCLNRLHKVGLNITPIPRPNDVLEKPSRHLFEQYEKARTERDRYMAKLIEEAATHDMPIKTNNIDVQIKEIVG